MRNTCLVRLTSDPNVLEIIAPLDNVYTVRRGGSSGFWLNTGDGKALYMGEDVVDVKRKADEMWAKRE